MNWQGCERKQSRPDMGQLHGTAWKDWNSNKRIQPDRDSNVLPQNRRQQCRTLYPELAKGKNEFIPVHAIKACTQQPLFYTRLFYPNFAFCKCTPLLNLGSLIFGLSAFYYATPLFLTRILLFCLCLVLSTAAFSGTQLGHETKFGCMLKWSYCHAQS
jgi:hypothetical protein